MFRLSVAAALGVLVVVVAALAIYAVRSVLVLAFIALFIAVSLDPAVRLLVRHGVRRSMAVALIFVLSFLAVVGLAAAIGPPLIRQGVNLSRDLPHYIDQLRSNSLRTWADKYGVTKNLKDLAATLPEKIGTSALGFVQAFFGALVTTLLVIVLTIYFMASLPRLSAGVVRLIPVTRRHHAQRVIDVTIDKVGAYMIGNLIISLVAGVATFIVLEIVRVPFALPLALVVAITDLIPMIGATLGAAVCVIVAAISTNLWPTAVIVLIYFIVYQQVENYLIAPRVLRNAVDLPALGVLLAGLIGAAVLGLVGALVAIPIAAVIKVLASPMIRDDDEDEPGTAAAEGDAAGPVAGAG
jgi:predicted PurR-regulated permease PerM